MASLLPLNETSNNLQSGKSVIMVSEDSLKEKLQNLQKQLGKKQSFEEAVSSIKSILIHNYSSSSPSLRKSIYTVICRVATILQSRYTAPGFWLAGKLLFEEAECLVTDSSEKKHLKTCIAKAREHLHEMENVPDIPVTAQRGSGYLFEGHLTVDPEPRGPADDFQNIIDMAVASYENNRENNISVEAGSGLLEEVLNNMARFPDLEAVIQASMQDAGAGPSRRPPASKDVVKKLPIITISEEVLARLGNNSECAVCREDLVINDKMQELPCKHLFHPPCLKPWLDEHNSCPICRYELPTDDHKYESQKEREKEEEEERKGAANALPGGEYMIV